MHFIDIENRRPGGLWWKLPVVLLIWLTLIAPGIAIVVGLSTIRGYATDLPFVPQLSVWREQIPQSSIILAADGSVAAEFPFTDGELVGHRRWVHFDEIPPLLIQAFLAAEDARFFSHRGIDPQAILRAARANYRAGALVEGASTITQQLARNLLPESIGDARNLRRKVREALIAYRFEQRYSKHEIFEAYVNLIFLGNNNYGIGAAAARYFGKQVDELTLEEAALLAGLAQAPGGANPSTHPVAAKARRNQVLERMLAHNYINSEQKNRAISTDILLVENHETFGTIVPWHTEKVRQILERDYPELYHRGGLVIETTAQPALSLQAIERSRRGAVAIGGRVSTSTRGTQLKPQADEKTLEKETQPRPQVAALLWDYRTGYLETVVGGREFSESIFNRATQACRQPGSAFKPILYGAALERDAITPATALRDGPIAEWDDDLGIYWKPHNSGRTFRGVAIAQDALAASLNAPAVDVFDRIGGESVIQFARRLGITTKLVDVRPLALGASCVIPIELAGALATIANRGQAVDLIWIKQIRRGNQIIVDNTTSNDPMLASDRRLDRMVAVATTPERDPVTDPATSFMITSMLRDVVRRGTATAVRNIGRPVAGKTGTTNENSDAWFVGFSARVVAVTWVGYDNPARHLPSRSDGAHAALPIWRSIVVAAEGGRESVDILTDVPSELVRARIDRETGLLAEKGAGGAIDLYLRRGTVPTKISGTRPDLPLSLDDVTNEF